MGKKVVPQWLDDYKQETKESTPVSVHTWCLSENGLCSLRETVLPRFDDASSAIGVMGVRMPREVS
jgi:hypothetical protein